MGKGDQVEEGSGDARGPLLCLYFLGPSTVEASSCIYWGFALGHVSERL